MSKNTKLLIGIIGIILVEILLCATVLNNKHNATLKLNNAKIALNKANNAENKARDNQFHIKSQTLAPKSQRKATKHSIDQINNIIDSTFQYNSPAAYQKQSIIVRSLATGSFYKWWWGKSIKTNVLLMQGQARGRSYKRYYQNYQLTRQDNNHYYVYLQSAVLIGDAKASDTEPDTFFLKFVRKGKIWDVTRIKDVELSDSTKRSDEN